MSTSVNVLYLSYDGLTDPLGQSQILPYLCGLSAEYAISIISFEKKERFTEEKGKIEKICTENNIRWVPLPYHKKPPVISTMFDVWQLRRNAIRLHKEYGFKIVHCRSYITSLVGVWMKRKFGVRFIFDMRGFWADERVEGGLWNLKNPLFKLIYNFFKKKEKEFLSKSDYIISLTNNAKDEMLSWDVPMAPIEVIPTCVDMELFNPERIQQEERKTLRRELGIGEDDFVLLYLGSLGTWYLTNEMLAFFKALKGKKVTSKLLVVTADNMDLKDHPYSKDIIIRKAERHKVPLFINLATASIFFIKPSFSKKASAATKMGELLAMNIPIVTNKGWGDVEALFIKKQYGVLTDGFQTSELEESSEGLIRFIESNNDGLRNFAGTIFSLDVGVRLYGNVYSKL